ncbi:hypothetical protein BC628DRAFT_1404353 [Trametes gibbosa]|nr:hypothetical protein BC628DRAFT_1404353 [Trametes gibbosa]
MRDHVRHASRLQFLALNSLLLSSTTSSAALSAVCFTPSLRVLCAMSQSTKQPMSGLRSIKRDFSSNTLPPASQVSTSSDTDSVPWDPTPPKKLSGLEQRLKDIQDALNSQISSSENTLSQSLSQSQKRPSSSQNPPAKRRQLPSSWDTKETTSVHTSRPAYPSASSTRPSGATRRTDATEALVVPAATKNSATSKPAPVFLSQEQTHILRLVESGKSLFYTGSAGECFVSAHIPCSGRAVAYIRW